ncbi:MAG: PBP1A family penicillin-binding protein [Ectobacillus sp.]
MSENYRSREERKKAEKQQQEKQAAKTGKPRKKGSFFKKFLIACLLIGIVTLGAGVATFFAMVKDAPKIDESKLTVPLSWKFYDKDGNFIHEYGAEKRTPITYDQIPKVFEEALLATEDVRFYEHHGIDVKRTTKAIFENITGNFGSQGGSTITQQLIKMAFLSPEKTLNRKVQEWYLAYKLEQKYSKHEILEMYLNRINLGNRSWGLAAAAKNYYGIDVKDLDKLTLPQAAMLAGLPQAPNAYNPADEKNLEAATKRRNLVLTLMNKHGFISKKEMEDAMKVPVNEGVLQAQNQEMPYQAFLDAAVKEVESQVEDVNVGTDGLSIYTTLDPKAQAYAEQILDTNDIVSYPNDQFQAAFVFQDTKTGAVRAIGSGRKEHKATFRGSNFAIEMNRQPGSTFKPIFDYGPAIEYLKWSTYHQIEDKEGTTYSNGKPIRNWDGKYHGMMSIRKALQWSYNVPALLTLREVGMDKAKTFAENLGITFDGNQVYESYAIGGNAVNPLEMAGAYASFGNDGVYNQPHFVQKIVYPDGKEINFKPKQKRVMKDYTAYMITDMLRTVVDEGTGTVANVPSLDIAGKTGTTNFEAAVLRKYGYPSNATSDSWFAGYTPQYTMAVWTGYAKNGPGTYMNSNTSKISMYIFREMMKKFGTDRSAFEQPSSVVRMHNELYIKGEKFDDVPKVKPNAPGGLQAKYDQATNTISLNWSYNSEEFKDATFQVSYTLNGSDPKALPSTKSTNLTLSNVQPGGRYSFSVVAQANGQSSDAITATVVVPGAEPAQPEQKPEAPKQPQGGNNGGNSENNQGGENGTQPEIPGTPAPPGQGQGTPETTQPPATGQTQGAGTKPKQEKPEGQQTPFIFP